MTGVLHLTILCVLHKEKVCILRKGSSYFQTQLNGESDYMFMRKVTADSKIQKLTFHPNITFL